MTPDTAIRRPSIAQLLLEVRAAPERLAFAFNVENLRETLPRGDGHPVMVVPGFGAGDGSVEPLRHLLSCLGYRATGWGQGRNLGMRGPVKQALADRLQQLSETHGRVSLIGWSLGGVFVREMARHAPQHVRRVITLGSPINGDPEANNLMPLFRLINGGKEKTDPEAFARRITPPPVPCTAIHSRGDGIMAWRCCLEPEAPNTENLEVEGSHFGLIYNTTAIRMIAERLSRRRG